ncbi:hypothetical protein AMTRI_Chr02g264260 [Amborella trichopoda]
MAGRNTLIKATIANSPTYLMSILYMPAQVANRLNQLMRNFLWSGQEDKKKFHLVAWDKVCQPKDQGGLGIKVIRKHNAALLGKWWWRLATQPNALWAQVVKHKYNISLHSWLPRTPQRHNGSGVWKSLLTVLATFKSHTRFHPKEGFRVKCWQDLWLGPSPLCDVFPSLFSLARDQESSIAQELCCLGGRRVWNPSFRRNLTEQETNDFQRLSHTLHSLFLLSHGRDELVWTLPPLGKFSVASFYKSLTLSPTSHEAFSKIWSTIAPPKVQTFHWLAFSHRVLTVDNLQNRGLPISNRCALCECEEESNHHMFLHCEFSYDLWGRVLQLFCIHWVTPPHPFPR